MIYLFSRQNFSASKNVLSGNRTGDPKIILAFGSGRSPQERSLVRFPRRGRTKIVDDKFLAGEKNMISQNQKVCHYKGSLGWFREVNLVLVRATLDI